MSTGAIIVLVIVVLAVLFLVAWFVGGQARSKRLRQRFGPEYDRRLSETEDRRAAERELVERENRHKGFELKPLAVESRDRYTTEWTLVQERFVDEPGEAVIEADQLLHNVMRERGYPTESFDQQAADLSVEHGAVIGDYRDGHEIRTRHDKGEASTEDLRKALVHYRSIFTALVGDEASRNAEPEPEAHTDRKAHH
jgi:hypothetical protein